MSKNFVRKTIEEKKKKKQKKEKKAVKKRQEETLKKFNIDLEKGLFVGASIPLSQTIEKEIVDVEPLHIPWGDLAGHLAVYGTTRVGKTRLMVSMIRQVILANWDLVIVEPKGSIGQETIAWILQFLEEAGRLRDFKYISPAFSWLSMKFNPVFGMSNEEIASLVSNIVPAKDEFYPIMGKTITYAISVGLDFLEKAEGRENVKKLIREEYEKIASGNANIIDEVENISDPDLADRIVFPTGGITLADIEPPYRSLMTFRDLATYSSQEGLKAILSHVEKVTEDQFNVKTEQEIYKLKELKAEAMRVLKEQAEKDQAYFSKVSTSYNVAIQELASGDIGEVFCKVKVNPLMDGFRNPERGQIVLVQPFPLKYKKTSDSFVRIFFAMFTAAVGDIGAAGRRFPRDIGLFVDEGGSVLYPGVEHLFNKAGGLGMRIFIYTQSFADYDAELGEDIAKIVNDNTNTKIYMRMNDLTSRQEIADAFGTIMVSKGTYMGSKIDMRISVSENEKSILIPAHIAQLQKQEFLIQTQKGNFLCVAPFQPDPDYWVEMPETELEKLYRETAADFAYTVKASRFKARTEEGIDIDLLKKLDLEGVDKLEEEIKEKEKKGEK